MRVYRFDGAYVSIQTERKTKHLGGRRALSVLNGQREEGCLQSPLWRPFVVHGNKTKREGEQGEREEGGGDHEG